jgi:hypothetical protein
VIAVADVLRAVPDVAAFCSVQQLQALVDTLRGDPRFDVSVAGTSGSGIPIHHMRMGTGRVKALFVAFPHCSEPIGGLTVFALLTLLRQRHPALIEADVEWHVVPCIDPDGAMLNEGWTLQPFTLDRHMRHFYKQELADQPECSFPISYKRLVFDRPTAEAKILRQLLNDIRPDLYCSLHNTAVGGGAWFCLTRDIGDRAYQRLYALLEAHQIPLQPRPPFREWCVEFAPGIEELLTTRRYYDGVEVTTPHPELVLQWGACSWEYLAEIKPSALTFVAELPYVKHPSDGSPRETGEYRRRLKLRLDAENKFLVTVILEEWERVKGELDAGSPFYRKIAHGIVAAKDTLHEGLPSSPYKARDLLFNPAYSGRMTEGERFDEYLRRFHVLSNMYGFVRLLRAGQPTSAVWRAIERVEPIFDDALAEVVQEIDGTAFQVIDGHTLARVQLGSALIALDTVLERQTDV